MEDCKSTEKVSYESVCFFCCHSYWKGQACMTYETLSFIPPLPPKSYPPDALTTNVTGKGDHSLTVCSMDI